LKLESELFEERTERKELRHQFVAQERIISDLRNDLGITKQALETQTKTHRQVGHESLGTDFDSCWRDSRTRIGVNRRP